MKIKICGLKRPEDVNYVNQSLPDFAGFVFAGTKRKIDFDTAYNLKKALNPSIPSIGVFVNAKIGDILHLVRENVLDYIQLHGDETEEYIITLRSELKAMGKEQIPIIKAVRVMSTEQVLNAEQLSVDYLLLDAFVAGEYGGSGKVFDHTLIPHLKKPFFLAGGIDSNNIETILETLKKEDKVPFCIDVSSSVETEGNKDEEKIAEMVSVIRHLH